MLNPIPTYKEIRLDPHDMIVSKTDALGVITYGNRNFVNISGYKESELVGSPHNLLRHPDMPKAIFYLMWESIKAGKNIMAVVKNLAKNGDHYWVTTDFDIHTSKSSGARSYIAFRQAAPKHAVKKIESLYKTMIEIEKKHGIEESVDYLNGFLEEKGMDYHQYIESLVTNKGLTGMMFNKMKQLFA
jgi:PAS domain S-box-containing protein